MPSDLVEQAARARADLEAMPVWSRSPATVMLVGPRCGHRVGLTDQCTSTAVWFIADADARLERQVCNLHLARYLSYTAASIVWPVVDHTTGLERIP